jgi:hypothetical protein
LVLDGHLDPKSKNHVHFDVQHLNIITWKARALVELTERVKFRIQGSIGQGPIEPGQLISRSSSPSLSSAPRRRRRTR